MSEKSEVTQKQVGYSWSVTIKKTTRTPKEGSKYDDVAETEANLGGHEETFYLAHSSLAAAKTKLTEELGK